MPASVEEISQLVNETSAWLEPFQREMRKVIVGQDYLVERLIMGLLANGHVLLEGVPGLAKTLSVRTLAHVVGAQFSRIQFTPDLLPADIVGTLIYNPRTTEFFTKKGPVFANIVLADEINRAPAKVQSALLEAMQERQVTLGDETYPLPKPFLVLATENPIDQEGTYPLPEAQVDRFMMKLVVGYPSKAEERQILDAMASTAPSLETEAVITPEQILDARKVVDQIIIDDSIKDYIVDIVLATRKPSDYGLEMDHLVQFGASPRATIALTLAAKARAFLNERAYVVTDDIKQIGPDVLRHRVIPSYEAEAEEYDSMAIVRRVFSTVPVP